MLPQGAVDQLADGAAAASAASASAAPAGRRKIIKVAPRQFDAGRLMAPKEIPKNVAIIHRRRAAAFDGRRGVVGGVPGGVPGGTGGVLGGIIGAAPPPPPPPPKVKEVQADRAAAYSRRRQRAGGESDQESDAALSAAGQAGAHSGTVRFTAIIGKDGTIQNLQLVSGHPLLVPSATEAVKQWVYKPTLLNGEPVEVITQIDVNFTLSQ